MITDRVEIPTNFLMPSEYRHRFILKGIESAMEIRPASASTLFLIHYMKDGETMLGDFGMQKELDWIQETIERIRKECSA